VQRVLTIVARLRALSLAARAGGAPHPLELVGDLSQEVLNEVLRPGKEAPAQSGRSPRGIISLLQRRATWALVAGLRGREEQLRQGGADPHLQTLSSVVIGSTHTPVDVVDTTC